MFFSYLRDRGKIRCVLSRFIFLTYVLHNNSRFFYIKIHIYEEQFFNSFRSKRLDRIRLIYSLKVALEMLSVFPLEFFSNAHIRKKLSDDDSSSTLSGVECNTAVAVRIVSQGTHYSDFNLTSC